MQSQGRTPQLPELVECEYLHDYLVDAGPCMSGTWTPAPLTAAELDAWSRGTGAVVTPWEFRVLLGMSRAYVDRRLAGPDAAAPMSDPGRSRGPDPAAMRAAMRSLA